jgi:hypothetical protein
MRRAEKEKEREKALAPSEGQASVARRGVVLRSVDSYPLPPMESASELKLAAETCRLGYKMGLYSTDDDGLRSVWPHVGR